MSAQAAKAGRSYSAFVSSESFLFLILIIYYCIFNNIDEKFLENVHVSTAHAMMFHNVGTIFSSEKFFRRVERLLAEENLIGSRHRHANVNSISVVMSMMCSAWPAVKE